MCFPLHSDLEAARSNEEGAKSNWSDESASASVLLLHCSSRRKRFVSCCSTQCDLDLLDLCRPRLPRPQHERDLFRGLSPHALLAPDRASPCGAGGREIFDFEGVRSPRCLVARLFPVLGLGAAADGHELHFVDPPSWLRLRIRSQALRRLFGLFDAGLEPFLELLLFDES